MADCQGRQQASFTSGECNSLSPSLSHLGHLNKFLKIPFNNKEETKDADYGKNIVKVWNFVFPLVSEKTELLLRNKIVHILTPIKKY